MEAKKFGDYELVKELASGSFGKTYLAKSPDGRKVALKIMHPHLANDPKAKIRFKREMQILEKLNHPQIAKIIESGEVDGIPFIALEFVEGRSLREILNEKGKFDEKDALKLFKELAFIVSYLHEQGVVHRDLKPENILIHKGKPRLIDFGLAKSIDLPSITIEGAVLGTLHYIPPEVLKGGEYSQKGDVYALGVILYELLSGRRPFEADSVSELIDKIVESEPHRPEGVSDETWQLVSALIDKNPSKRPELYEILTSVEVKKVRRSHVIAAVLALTLAIASAVIVYTTRTRHPSPTESRVVLRDSTSGAATHSESTKIHPVEATDVPKELHSLVRIKLSHPSDVFVDEQLLSRGTKIIEFLHDTGTVRIKVRNPDYGVLRRTLRLSAGDTARLDIDFDREFGTLIVKVKPWGYVWFDDKFLGTSPIEKPIHGRGRHTVKVEHPIFGTTIDTVDLQPGDTLVWRYEFQR